MLLLTLFAFFVSLVFAVIAKDNVNEQIRFGGLLFYDVGHSAPTFDELLLRHDVGVGVRWLIVQLNSSVIRFDWAIPLNDGAVTRAGVPGRVSAGFQQIF